MLRWVVSYGVSVMGCQLGGSKMSRKACISLVFFVALGVSWTSIASAQGPKYRRASKIKVKVKQTQRTRRIGTVKKKKKVRPRLTADDFIAIQGQVGFIRESQIEGLKQLIEETDQDSVELPDLYFRLAETYSQQQRYWKFRAMELYTSLDKLKKGTPEYNQTQAKQKKFFKASNGRLVQAIREYKKLTDEDSFRNYSRMGRALFHFAYMLQGVKRFKEARKVFHRLIQDHPSSKYIPEAYLAFADYFFEQNSMANAEQYYNKVLKFRNAPIYTYALYKKGWVFLNLKNYSGAMSVFSKVVGRTRTDKRRKNLNRAAKKDYVRAYAHVGKAQTAYRAFRRLDRSYAFKMLQTLADIYLDQGDSAKSIYTFRELMRINPKHKLVCEWQYHVVQAILSASVGKRKKVDEIANLVRLYKAVDKRKAIPADNLQECRENAIGVNSELAKLWHNEVIKTLNSSTLAQVDRLYKMFLDNFPKSDEYGEMLYYNAELLWMRAESEKDQRRQSLLWERVAVAFTDVVKNAEIDDEQRKEAAKASVLAWKNALAVDPGPGVETNEKAYSKVPKPKPIGERQQKMIAAFDVYINYIKNPKDDERVMMKFLKARIYWRHNHFDKAIPQFEDIIESHINHETAEYSANLLLDTLNRMKRYDQLVVWAKKLQKKKKFLDRHEDLAVRLKTIIRKSLRKRAEELEKKGEYVACGQAYLEIFNQDPGATDAEEVLYNAVFALRRENRSVQRLACFAS